MTTFLRVAVAVAAAALATACWQDTRVHSEGEVRGFSVGASKREAFEAALRNQESGVIVDLELIGEPPTTYAEKYRGTPIAPDDYARVAESDHWHTALAGCNCWLRLIFQDGRLSKIEEHEWTGPTL